MHAPIVHACIIVAFFKRNDFFCCCCCCCCSVQTDTRWGQKRTEEDEEEASIISLPSVCVCVLVVLLLPGLPSHLSKEGEKQQERTAFSIASTGPYPEMEGAGVRPLAHSVVIDDLTCNHHLLFSERLVKKMKKKGKKE